MMDELFLILQGLWYLLVMAFALFNALILIIVVQEYLKIRAKRKSDEKLMSAVEEFRNEFDQPQ